MLQPHAHRPDLLAQVETAWRSPSLYDVSLQLLAREGIDVPADRLERDWTQPYEASEGVKQAWITVYRDPHKHWDLYQLGEKLADIEDADRKSTRLNSSHSQISYAVFCLKKKKK